MCFHCNRFHQRGQVP